VRLYEVSLLLLRQLCALALRLLHQLLSYLLFFVFGCVEGAINRLVKEGDVSACSFDVFLDLLPDLLVLEVLVPGRVSVNRQRVVHYLLLLLLLLLLIKLKVGLDDELMLPDIVDLALLLQVGFPLPRLRRQVPQQHPPDYRPQTLHLVRDTRTEAQILELGDVYLFLVED
jgi:hypothetical protein